MASSRKKGKTIHSEAREIVRQVIEKCDEEARRGETHINIHQRNARASDYTGISERTISRIRKECKEAGDSNLSTPGKHRHRPSTRNVEIDNFDLHVIRNTIHDFYIVQKQVPTCPKLLAAVKEKIDFPWGVDSLRKILKTMGFRWKKSQNKRKVLMERPDILNWRWRYLKSIRKAREEQKSIVYIDETWIDNNLTYKKCWQSEDVFGVQTYTSSSNRLIVVHAGCEEGFVQNTLLIFKSGLSTGDYHGQMNAENFEKWVKEKLLPNIRSNSLIVLDNAPYHSVEENKPPTKYSNKSAMITWLERNNVPCRIDMRKVELLDLIAKYKNPGRIFRVDKILQGNGHEVLRLPPYMCEFNPIELAWAKVKRIIRDSNIQSDLSLKNLKEKTEQAFAKVSQEDWKGFCEHVKNIENGYWEKDGVMETEIDKFIIAVTASDSSSSDSESDSDLAQCLSDSN